MKKARVLKKKARKAHNRAIKHIKKAHIALQRVRRIKAKTRKA